MDKNSGWKVVAARLIMIVGIGYLNTLFVSIEMYHTEIMAQIQENKDQKIASISDSITAVTNEYQSQRDQLQSDVDKANRSYLAWSADEQSKIDAQRTKWVEHQEQFMGEVAGHAGSHLKGWGDAAKADYVIIQDDSTTLQQMIAKFDADRSTAPVYLALVDAKNVLAKRDPELLSDIEKNRSYLDTRKVQVQDLKQDGFGDRVDAMWAQAGKRPFTFAMTFLFFLMLEAMPVLMKMMSVKGTYEEELRLHAEEFAVERMHQRNINVQTANNKFDSDMNSLIKTGLENKAIHNESISDSIKRIYTSNASRAADYQKHLEDIDTQVSVITDPDQRKAMREILVTKLATTYATSLS